MLALSPAASTPILPWDAQHMGHAGCAPWDARRGNPPDFSRLKRRWASRGAMAHSSRHGSHPRAPPAALVQNIKGSRTDKLMNGSTCEYPNDPMMTILSGGMPSLTSF